MKAMVIFDGRLALCVSNILEHGAKRNSKLYGLVRIPIAIGRIAQQEKEITNGSVAQLNSASDFGSEGYRFESCRGHKIEG
jgi:hypothetical protein